MIFSQLFYYMHQQIIARYNADRMANGLERAKNFSLDEPILEGYFPKIIRSKNQSAYAARAAGSALKDIVRKDAAVSVDDLRRWRDRVFEAIDSGFANLVRKIFHFM